jgi:hypothetical protein
MTAALVQSAANTEAVGSGITVTLGATPTVGNLLIAVAVKRGVWVPSVSSSGWTLLDAMHCQSSPSDFVVWYYKIAGSSESTSVVFVSSGGADQRACFAEFSGCGAFDAKATALNDQSGATTHTTNAVTPTAGQTGLIISAIGKQDNNESFLAVGSGYTLLDGGTVAEGQSPQYIVQYKAVAPTSGSYTATATEPRSAAWCGNIAAFSGGGFTIPPRAQSLVLA